VGFGQTDQEEKTKMQGADFPKAFQWENLMEKVIGTTNIENSRGSLS